MVKSHTTLHTPVQTSDSDSALGIQDGVGPFDNRPSTNNLSHFVNFEFLFIFLHVTHDTGHLSRDT